MSLNLSKIGSQSWFLCASVGGRFDDDVKSLERIGKIEVFARFLKIDLSDLFESSEGKTGLFLEVR